MDKPKLFIFKNKILGLIYKLVNFYNLKNLIVPIEKHRTLTLDEEKFYVDNFISYLDILKDDKSALFEKGLYIDFFLLML